MPFKIFLNLLALFLVISCTQSNTNENNNEEGFSIYLLKDTTIYASTIFESNVENLILTSKPFISQKDLNYYKWNTHSFELDSTKITMFKKKFSYPTPMQGIPFVVTVNKEKIYHGAFWNPASSIYPVLPHINVFYDSFKTPFILTIKRASNTRNIDVRNDDRIYNCLKKMNLIIE